jgi:hypothetical protein
LQKNSKNVDHNLESIHILMEKIDSFFDCSNKISLEDISRTSTFGNHQNDMNLTKEPSLVDANMIVSQMRKKMIDNMKNKKSKRMADVEQTLAMVKLLVDRKK